MTKKSNAQVVIENTDPKIIEQITGEAPTMVQTITHSYKELLETHGSKSAMIRFLSAEGHKRGPISKFMGIKYQFVRNVLIQPLKKTS